MQKRMKLLKNQKGMTLVELLAVLVILGIIAAIAIPMIGNAISESKQKGELNDALNIIAAAKLADANGDKAGSDDSYTKEELVEGGYLDDSASTSFTSVDKKDKQWILKGYKFNKATKIAKTGGGYSEANIKKALKGEVPTPTTP
ncbi:type II secretion system GspH family protein [Caldibacillus sp. 210928-DFI.2.22]|uniref:type II secretion system protein n=1 Tax=unclassified Caldibacillus TaxID=2641266 RepID=UPI001D07387A|nr:MULTISPECIES: type II secretion system protein [unclassified Caldibacillus]MCB7070096.1 type II secretion system GspH family protein [Caldibacillus sp. 210928-DFI.2.22]MCB7072613.1 type II secretion system GspH family protein [Caldibacillus sp. 210928-DFI.2.18]